MCLFKIRCGMVSLLSSSKTVLRRCFLLLLSFLFFFFFFQAEDGIRDLTVTGVQTCALPISFGKPELRALWKQAADLGLIVQLHFEPKWAPGFEPLIQEFSGTTVIIDHLGRPLQGTPEEHARVLGWSRFKNTVIKLSALPPSTQFPHRDAAPFVRQAADAFGPDRMIYGGGFEPNATGESYLAAR